MKHTTYHGIISKAQLFKLSIECSKIQLYQPLTCGRGCLSPHNFAFSIKILHAQCTLSLLELSPSGHVMCAEQDISSTVSIISPAYWAYESNKPEPGALTARAML